MRRGTVLITLLISLTLFLAYYSHLDRTARAFKEQRQDPERVAEDIQPTSASAVYFDRLRDRNMQFDSHGHPHIVYGADDHLYHAWFDGSIWRHKLVDGAMYVGSRAKLAIDSEDNLHVVYEDEGNRNYKYAYHDGYFWIIETIPFDGGRYSLALDSLDRPHISFWSPNALKHGYRVGGKWYAETAYYGYANDPAIVLDSLDRPRIAFQSGPYPDYDVRYSWYDGHNWHTDLVDNTNWTGDGISLALADDGTPHISYVEPSFNDLMYAWRDGSTWRTRQLDRYVSRQTSIVVDSNGYPRIAYRDGYDIDYHDIMRIAQFNGSQWDYIDVGFSSGGYTSLLIDDDDHSHVSYTGNDPCEMKYAHYDGSTWLTDTVTYCEERPELSITHFEVTQAVQDEQNNVPLIAGKPTVVRVFIDCGVGCSSLTNITGTLRGFDNSVEFSDSPRAADNEPIIAYHDIWTNQRDDLGKSLNFKIPDSWTSGAIELVAEVGGAQVSETISFEVADSVNVVYAPIRYQGQIPDDRIHSDFYLAKELFPIDRLNYIPGPTIIWDDCLADCDDEKDNRKQFLSELTDLYRGINNVSVYGWLPANSGVRGLSDPTWYGGDGIAAFGITGRPDTFAHEIAHLYGRRHSNTQDNINRNECEINNSTLCLNDNNCRANVDPKSDWVNHPGLPDPPPFDNSTIQDLGFRVSKGELEQPAETFDIMSYCHPRWISPWTYERLMDEINVTTEEYKSASASALYFMISGLVFSDTTALLNPTWIYTTSQTIDSSSPGSTFCVMTKNSSNVTLESYCFDPIFWDYESGDPSDVDSFNVLLPYSAETTRIVVQAGSDELISQTRTANAPVVDILFPDGGESLTSTGYYTVTWSANDDDGDSLTYRIYYNQGGAEWIPLGKSTTEKELKIDASELAGGDLARVRVVATDGFNTGSDVSENPFSIGLKAPLVSILVPVAGTNVSSKAVLLQGYAYDLEDGVLDEQTYLWQSSKDGDLGSGNNLVRQLSRGQQDIMLTVTDSDGMSSTATISVMVGSENYLPFATR